MISFFSIFVVHSKLKIMALFLGDIHGAFHRLIKRIEHKNITGENIIQVGDFGIGFQSFVKDREMLAGLNQFLSERFITLYAIRGNHDDPAYFIEDEEGNTPMQFSNIKFIPDYTVKEIDGMKMLFVGGALSIDRKPRINEELCGSSKTYWEDEGFVFDKEKLESLDLKGLDILVAHTSPKFAWPQTMGSIVYHFAKGDLDLIRDLEHEREWVTTFYKVLDEELECPPKKYIYGHFHSSHITPYKDTEFRLLDIDEFYEVKKKDLEKT